MWYTITMSLGFFAIIYQIWGKAKMPKTVENKEFWKYNSNTFCVPWQGCGTKVLECNYCDKLRQIGAIGLVGYYGFTTIAESKIENVK